MERDVILSRLRRVLGRYHIPKAYLFGSFARHERKYNDIDIAIEPPKGKFSLLDLVGVEQALEDETGKKVDLVLYRSIKPALRPYIKKDLQVLI